MKARALEFSVQLY